MDLKDQMIECMPEDLEDLQTTLDDIEVAGQQFECPNERCDERVCSKSCFARSCFDWCLTHSHPSVEHKDGTVSVTIKCYTRDAQGQLVCRTEVEERRQCGHEEARISPGHCNIIVSPFVGDVVDGVAHTPESQLELFEWEQYMGGVMAHESP